MEEDLEEDPRGVRERKMRWCDLREGFGGNYQAHADSVALAVPPATKCDLARLRVDMQRNHLQYARASPPPKRGGEGTGG